MLVDNELLAFAEAINTEVSKMFRRRRQNTIRRARILILKLGAVAHRADVGVRIVVQWVRPTGNTIPPYLVGEAVPEIRDEFDSHNLCERELFEALARRKDELGDESVLELAEQYRYGDELIDGE